jgi:thioesterase domain-containing protein
VRLFAPEGDTTAAPLFCVHSLGANLVSFHKIASLMGGTRPIYGLQPHGLNGLQEPLDSLESIASAYLAEVRRIQPHGPYYLSGVCIGGVVAFEMAQQLKADGEEVALLALIDSFLPGPLQHLHSRNYMVEYLDRHLGDLLRLSGFGRLRYLARWLANGVICFGRSVGMRHRSSLAQATRRVAIAHKRAVNTYQPRPYSGNMVQLMCSDASHRTYEDRRLAWSSLTTSGLQVRLIPGNHLTMVEEPHAQVLARELQDCLSRATSLAY